MDTFSLVRQGVLFAHLLAFAIALSAVLREDLALLAARRIDLHRLAGTARTLTHALVVLWASGLALVAFDVGLDVQALAASPKLAAKLCVVSALTANGLALHALAFPMLRRARPRERFGLIVPAVLGAISTTSWLYASFIGASRLIAQSMRFTDFIAIYAVLLAGAVAVALVFVRLPIAARPRVRRAMSWE